MNTNRLSNVATRQRVNRLRDLLFVALVATILIFQVVTLAQSPEISKISTADEVEVSLVESLAPTDCIAPTGDELTASSIRAPLC